MTTITPHHVNALEVFASHERALAHLLLMLMLISINYIDRASISVAMPTISKEFDLDPAMQGFILSSFFITYALMQIPAACSPIASSHAS